MYNEHPALFVLIARSLLLISTSFVSRTINTLYPLFFKASLNFSPTSSVSWYSYFFVATPLVPDETFGFLVDEPGAISSKAEFPLTWCPGSIQISSLLFPAAFNGAAIIKLAVATYNIFFIPFIIFPPEMFYLTPVSLKFFFLILVSTYCHHFSLAHN